jgi:hypothetical protein
MLERRRAAASEWNADAEAALTAEARTVLAEAGRAFKEVADDAPYWQRVEQTILTVVLPRYFKAAKEQHALEAAHFGVWRGGDLLSRAAYALGGLFLGALVWRLGVPKWIEPLPLVLFVLGPLIPDLQESRARRRYKKELAVLIDDMALEQADRHAYLPTGVDEHVASGTNASTSSEKRDRSS